MSKKDKKPKGEKRPKISTWQLWGQFGNQVVGTFLILMILVGLYSALANKSKTSTEIALSDLAAAVVKGEVTSIVVTGDNLEATYQNGDIKTSKKETERGLSETLATYGVTPQALNKVKLEVKSDSGWTFWLATLLPIIVPIIFVIVFFWLISRQVKGASMQAFSFGQSRARVIDPDDANQKVTFKDVAGVKEAKEELLEIVDFLKNPKKFIDIGARIPKGVLMMGAPGTGKTLLARAVAGEAGVPFFYLSGSEFVEMFVGVGASRVRDLFKLAKRAAPAIIFIDEIDAIGRHRGSGMGGGNDEREQTLNQILVEMDGFEPNEKLIVMAATNRPDVLDPALLRPGRFDRRVLLDSPDIKDREEILGLHARKKPLGADVNLRVIAERTPGFSGADLANLMNEAAILAARENRTEVTQYDLIRSVEKVMLGPERRSHILSVKEKKITAYHEMGHALVASALPHADPVHKVSIISRGHAAGYTLKLPLEDRKLQSRKEFLDDIAMSLGGYAAEMLVFGDITTGASNDIQVATSLARDMVTRYGMSDKLGPRVFADREEMIFLAQEIHEKKNYSERTAEMIDEEVSKLLEAAKATAQKILTEKRSVVEALVKALKTKETIEQEEFITIVGEKVKKVDVRNPGGVTIQE